METPDEGLEVTIAPIVVRCTLRAVLPPAIALLLAATACAHGAPETAAEPFVHSIEKPALRRPDSPAPRYPKELLATRDTGTVVLRAVVEASGRVDPKSIEVVSSPHPAFTQAAVQALRDSRFIPAEVETPGRPARLVSQAITVPIFFAPPPTSWEPAAIASLVILMCRTFRRP
jgi:TonB family protein